MERNELRIFFSALPCGAPVWLVIFVLHVALFIASTALRPAVFMSLLPAFSLLICGCCFSCLSYTGCSSNIFASDLIFLCFSAHPFQHPHLIRLCPCFLSFCCCPGLCHYRTAGFTCHYCLVDLSPCLHWHPHVAQYSTAFFQFPQHALNLCVIAISMPRRMVEVFARLSLSQTCSGKNHV